MSKICVSVSSIKRPKAVHKVSKSYTIKTLSPDNIYLRYQCGFFFCKYIQPSIRTFISSVIFLTFENDLNYDVSNDVGYDYV